MHITHNTIHITAPRTMRGHLRVLRDHLNAIVNPQQDCDDEHSQRPCVSSTVKDSQDDLGGLCQQVRQLTHRCRAVMPDVPTCDNKHNRAVTEGCVVHTCLLGRPASTAAAAGSAWAQPILRRCACCGKPRHAGVCGPDNAYVCLQCLPGMWCTIARHFRAYCRARCRARNATMRAVSGKRGAEDPSPVCPPAKRTPRALDSVGWEQILPLCPTATLKTLTLVDRNLQARAEQTFRGTMHVQHLPNLPAVAARWPCAGLSITLGPNNGAIENLPVDPALLARITRVAMHDEFDQPIDALVSLHNLQHLVFGEQFNQPIDALVSLRNLQHLEFGRRFNQPIDALAELRQLRHLRFGSYFRQFIDALAGLKQLQYLHMGAHFNRSIDALAGLHQLRHLDLGFYFNQPIDALAGLSQLRVLISRWDFDHPIDALAELKELQYLNLGDDFKQPIDALAKLKQLPALGIWTSFQPAHRRLGRAPPAAALALRERLQPAHRRLGRPF